MSSQSSILTVVDDDPNPHVLIEDARHHIGRLNEEECIGKYEIRTKALLTALLDHTVDEGGQVYIAKSIRDALQTDRNELNGLTNLAKSWLENVLWPSESDAAPTADN